MIYFETCGLPGSGKSTFIHNATVALGEIMGPTDLIRHFSTNDKFPPAINRSHFRRAAFQLGIFRNNYTRFSEIMDQFVEINLVDWVLLGELGFAYHIGRAALSKDKIVATDEGFVNRLCAACARYALANEADKSKPLNQLSIYPRFEQALEHMPLPDTVVFLDVPLELALERYSNRLVSARIKTGAIAKGKQAQAIARVRNRLGGLPYLDLQRKFLVHAMQRVQDRGATGYVVTPETATAENIALIARQIVA